MPEIAGKESSPTKTTHERSALLPTRKRRADIFRFTRSTYHFKNITFRANFFRSRPETQSLKGIPRQLIYGRLWRYEESRQIGHM